MPEAFKQYFRALAENLQSPSQAIISVRRSWKTNEPLPGYEHITKRAGYPDGWNESELRQIVSDTPEL